MSELTLEKVAQVFNEVPRVLRSLSAERDGLLEKNASLRSELQEYKRRDRIEKIAHEMEEKGVDARSHQERVELIKESADAGRSLDVIEEAVKMAAGNGSLGDLGNPDEAGNGSSQLESFLLGGLSE